VRCSFEQNIFVGCAAANASPHHWHLLLVIASPFFHGFDYSLRGSRRADFAVCYRS
jgi:hypothetical protein